MTTTRPAEAGSAPVEVHVSSLLVQSRPERTEALARMISALPTVDVPTFAAGRLVVTLVSEDERSILDTIGAIRDLPGVLSAELVFHSIDRDEGSR